MMTGSKSGSTKKKLLVVDDHPIVQEGLRHLVSNEPDLCICQGVAAAKEALAAVRREKPSAIILDLHLQNEDGVDLLRAIKFEYPQIPVLILSMSEEDFCAEQCLRMGASGYVMKKAAPSVVLAAIRTILSGRRYISDSLKDILLLEALQGAQTISRPLDLLSPRELQVFRHVGSGSKTQVIAVALGISAKTVHAHIENIKTKLSLPDLRSLLIYALKHSNHPEQCPPAPPR